MLLTGHLDSDPDLGHMKKLLMYCIMCGHSTLLKIYSLVFTSLYFTSESKSLCGVTFTISTSSEDMIVFKQTEKD